MPQDDLNKTQRAYARITNHVNNHRGKYSALATAVTIGVPAYYKMKIDAAVIDALGGNEPAGFFVVSDPQ